MKVLIDECLSAELTKAALDRGHSGSSHVRWIGKAGVKDWNLFPLGKLFDRDCDQQTSCSV